MGLLGFLLASLVQFSNAGWRNECNVEGVEVEVTFHGSRPPAEGVCRVAFLTHEDIILSGPGEPFGNPDVVFTDSLQAIRFAGRRDNVHFIENVSAFEIHADLDKVMLGKTKLLSVLVPPVERWDDLTRSIVQQAELVIPKHIYFDDGTPEAYEHAFLNYRFSLVAESANHTISEAFVRSVGLHTVALFNGFVEVGAMVFNGVADFFDQPFNFTDTLETVRKHNEHLGALWHYQRILQDQLQYRYNRPFAERIMSQACTLCRLHAWKTPENDHQLPVFVGIYSARENFEKRQVVRQTWGRLLRESFGIRYLFFLGEPPEGASAEDVRARKEADQHGDVIFLDTLEGYRMNSQKGLLFLQWIALHTEAEFLLKVDDDVYFRPAPLLVQLQSKPPTQYVWGYWDYISPVPREEEHHFFNTIEDFPFDVFAPYPRGVVRVLSMDIVRMMAEAGRKGKFNMIYGDDPCIGVHFRQLLFDKEEPLPSLTIDDFDNKVFAMEPSCHRKLWSKMTNRTWAVHHVSPEQILCMWNVDVREGYYHDAAGTLSYNPDVPLNEFPSLCECETDPAFYDRTDMDDLKEQTDAILYND